MGGLETVLLPFKCSSILREFEQISSPSVYYKHAGEHGLCADYSDLHVYVKERRLPCLAEREGPPAVQVLATCVLLTSVATGGLRSTGGTRHVRLRRRAAWPGIGLTARDSA